MGRLLAYRLLLVAVSLVTCGCGVTQREFDQIREYLYCVHCAGAERDSVRAIGRRARPFLRETLHGLPPGRMENLLRRYRSLQDRIATYGVDTIGFVDSNIANHIAVIQIRSAVALSDMEDWEALRMALESSEVWGYREDVIAAIQHLLFPLSVPVDRYIDGVITGTVRRASNGVPVNSLVVHRRRCESAPGVDQNGRIGCCDVLGPSFDSARTDENGRYQFSDLEEGVYQVSASREIGPRRFPHVHPAGGLVLLVGKEDTARVDFLLGELNTIQGRVRAQDGSPVTRGSLRITSISQHSSGSSAPLAVPGPGVASSLTVDTVLHLSDWGAFRVEGIPEGVFSLIPEAPTRLPGLSFPGGHFRLDTSGEEDTFSVDLEMVFEGQIQGVVGRDINKDGTIDLSLQNLRVILEGANPDTVTTGSAGAFSFSPTEGGDHELRLEGVPGELTTVGVDGKPAEVARVIVRARSPVISKGSPRWDFDRDRVTGAGPADFIFLTNNNGIRGVFQEKDSSRPVPGVPVILSRCERSAGMTDLGPRFPGRCDSYDSDFPQYPDTARTGNDGVYEFDRLLEGVYEVRVDQSGGDFTVSTPSYLVILRFGSGTRVADSLGVLSMDALLDLLRASRQQIQVDFSSG